MVTNKQLKNLRPKTGYQLELAKSISRLFFCAASEAIKREVGVTEHVLRRDLSGWSELNTRRISAPLGVTRRQLYVIAHECGHLACCHPNTYTHAQYLREYEAHEWAVKAMRRHGIRVTRTMIGKAKSYIASHFNQAERNGLVIPLGMYRWADTGEDDGLS